MKISKASGLTHSHCHRDMIALKIAEFAALLLDGGMIAPNAPGSGNTVNRNIPGDPVAAWEV